MPHVSRFRKRRSDRSGFDYYETQLVKDKGLWLTPEELDQPPPSKRSLGGEGDVTATGTRANSTFTVANAETTPTELDNPTVYITAAGGITATKTHPWMQVTGSNAAVNISANPQISAGRERDVLTLRGVGSNITLENGAGLSMMGSVPFVLESGRTITFYYSTANNAWNETSRGKL